MVNVSPSTRLVGKIVGSDVGRQDWSQREVAPRGRGGEEGTGRAVDLSGCNDRLAGFVHSITTVPSLRSRAHAQDQSGLFSAGPGSAGTRICPSDGEQSERLRHATFGSRSGSIEGRP